MVSPSHVHRLSAEETELATTCINSRQNLIAISSDLFISEISDPISNVVPILSSFTMRSCLKCIIRQCPSVPSTMDIERFLLSPIESSSPSEIDMILKDVSSIDKAPNDTSFLNR